MKEGRADLIGVCNFPPPLLEELLRLDGPRCSLHQTRLRADRAFNGEDRALAEKHGVVLQAPGLVTTNAPALRRSSALSALAAKRGATPERTLLAFALRLGVVAVVGSASPKHVLDDLGAVELAASLSPGGRRRRARGAPGPPQAGHAAGDAAGTTGKAVALRVPARKGGGR